MPPALLVYRALVAETAARRIVVCDASLRAGMLLDIADLGEPLEHRGVQPSGAGQRRIARASATGSIAITAGTSRNLRCGSSTSWSTSTGSENAQRLLLQVAALLHDVGIYVSLRSHHKHTQYILAASQIFGLSDEETAIVANIARYHRGALPQKTHLPVRRARSRGSHHRRQARGHPAHRQRASTPSTCRRSAACAWCDATRPG